MLFVISAPSGAGKTTIIKELFGALPELSFSVSATTRKKRENEIRSFTAGTPAARAMRAAQFRAGQGRGGAQKDRR